MNKLVFILLLFIFPVYSSAQQTFTYSYVDPCTGVVKSINVPSNGVTVTYFGSMNTFQPQDFTNGTFNQWATGVFNTFGGSNPCGSVLGVSTALNIAQTSAINSFNIISSISAISDIQQSLSSMSAMSTNGATESTKAKGKDSKKNNPNGQGGSNTSTGNASSNNSGGSDGQGNSNNSGSSGGQGNSNNSGSSGGQGGSNNPGSSGGQGGSNNPGSSNNPSGQGGSQGGSSGSQGGSSESQGGSSGTQGGSSGTQGGNNETPETTQPNETEEGKSNILGGTTNSIQNSSDNGNKSRGNAPTVILSSDFAGFNFVDNETSFGGKGTAGFTSLRWDGKRTHGFLLDYTSVVGGPNITGFYGFIGKRKIDLISISATASFIGRGSLYATAAAGQLRSFEKIKSLKLIYMATVSSGNVYGEDFIGTAAIAGGMYDWKIGKRIDIKLTGLYIYAPYVSYYNDIVLNSPHVILPLLGTNIGLTKKFKLNINVGGTYALNQNVMNYTVMFGARFAL